MIPERALSLRAIDPKALSNETAVFTGDESLVQQHFGNDVDINTIVRRFGLTRQMPSGVSGGVYGDFTGIVDYESAVAAIKRAEDGFLALPAEVRERFGNDPGEVIRLAHELPFEEFNGMMVVEPPPVVVVDPPAGG